MRPIVALALPLALLGCSKDGDTVGDEAPDAATAAAAAISAPQAGEYLTQTTLLDFEVAGVPAGQVDAFRAAFASGLGEANHFCLTPEEAREGHKRMVQHMAESDCTVSRLDISGSSMSGEMQCSGEGGLNGSVKIDGTVNGTGSSMVIETIQSVPGLPGDGARLKMRMDSRRLGECTG